MATKRTYQPSNLKRKRDHGFRARMKTADGRKILARRRAKGRRRLTRLTRAAFVAVPRLGGIARPRDNRSRDRRPWMPACPRSARVRQRAEFDRVFADGRRNADPLLSLHWLRGDKPARLGLAVSRKVDPRAVGRNRIKRVLRAEFRTLRSLLADGDYVLVSRAAAARKRRDRTARRHDIAAASRRRVAARRRGGTMPAACLPGDPPPSP